MFQFEILSNLQKSHKSLQVDGLPQLRLSPPAIYHEKVPKGVGLLAGETSNAVVKSEKSNKRWQLRDLKSKGSLNRFPLKSSIFGEYLDLNTNISLLAILLFLCSSYICTGSEKSKVQ